MGTSARPSIGLATSAGDWALDEDAPVLLDALDAADVHAEPAVWDDESVRWDGFDLVVVRSTWDYTDRPEQFLEWARRVESVTTLANPAATPSWNTDKHYLDALARAGVPVVPTSFIDATGAARDLTELLCELHDVVVKPTVSAGSRDTARHPANAHAAALVHVEALLESGRDVMVQPYLAEVEHAGETGMVYFDGRFSHSFRKGPMLVHGWADVRGSFAPEEITEREPSPSELAVGEQVMAACTSILGRVPVYARVDVIPDGSGEPILLELELTEPSFFLAHSRTGATSAAACLAAHARAVTQRR
jgi:hypothetical protein